MNLNRDALKFWGAVGAILVALVVAGLVRGRNSSPSPLRTAVAQGSPAAPPAPPALRPVPAPVQGTDSAPAVDPHYVAYLSLSAQRLICATQANRVSLRWNSLLGSGPIEAGDLVEAEDREKIQAAMGSLEQAMKAPGVQEGPAGAVLLDYYSKVEEICSLATQPAGQSLMTFNAEIGRLRTAADGDDAKLRLLVPSASSVLSGPLGV